MMTLITKKDFEDYEKVRKSGLTNMFMINQVCELSDGLYRDQVKEIIENYEKYNNMWPDIRGGEKDDV